MVWSSPAVSGVLSIFHCLWCILFGCRSAETDLLVCFPCSCCYVITDTAGTNSSHIPHLTPVRELNICISSVFSGFGHGQVIGVYASLRSFPSPSTQTNVKRYFVQTLKKLQRPLSNLPKMSLIVPDYVWSHNRMLAVICAIFLMLCCTTECRRCLWTATAWRVWFVARKHRNRHKEG